MVYNEFNGLVWLMIQCPTPVRILESNIESTNNIMDYISK